MIGESQIAKYATKLYRVTAQGWNAGLLWLVSRAGLSCMPLSTNWAVICDNKDEWRAAVWGVKAKHRKRGFEKNVVEINLVEHAQGHVQKKNCP